MVDLIHQTDIPDFDLFLTKHIEPDSETISAEAIADALLKKGLQESVDDCLYSACEEAKLLPEVFSPPRMEVLVDAMGAIMGILALLEVDDQGIRNFCYKSIKGHHYRIEGVYSHAGVEIVIRRLNIAKGYQPKLKEHNKLGVSSKGIIPVNHLDLEGWSEDEIINNILVDIWNAVQSHLKGSSFDERKYGDSLERGEVRQLNYDIGAIRQNKRNPACLFIMYPTDAETIVLRSYHRITTKLKELIAVAFQDSDDTSVFIGSEEAVIHSFKMIYGCLSSKIGHE